MNCAFILSKHFWIVKLPRGMFFEKKEVDCKMKFAHNFFQGRAITMGCQDYDVVSSRMP